jgi:predicted phosphodiesterase
MKVLIVADIHGNATALRAVLDDAGYVEALWCAGDIVGYGPDPAECIEMVREIPNICIAGNHDVGVAGNTGGVRSIGLTENLGKTENPADGAEASVVSVISAGSFNPEARIARDWTRLALDEEQISFLSGLPLMAEPLSGVLMAHGAPVAGIPVFEAFDLGGKPGVRDLDESVSVLSTPDGIIPSSLGFNAAASSEAGGCVPAEDTSESAQADRYPRKNMPSQDKELDSEKENDGNLGIWEYVTSSWQAEEVFSMSRHGFSQCLFIVGHTHVPLAFIKGDGAGVEYVPLETGDIIELDFVSFKYLLNPGSVGQPRDGDPRASYMLYDTETNVIEYRRVEYDVAEVIDRVDFAGLPHNLGARLEIGL